MEKSKLIDSLDLIKSIMISSCTGGMISREDEDQFKKIRQELVLCSQIQQHLPLIIKSNRSTNEVKNYMQGMFDHYAERRTYITTEINTLITFIEQYGINEQTFIKYEKTGWEKIDESIDALKKSFDAVSDRISLNEIGVRCRETLIMLASQVYVDEVHHPKSFPDEVSKTDAKRMFEGYIEYSFGGQHCEEKRSYAKACNKLADFLTHSQNLTKMDARLCINATISLIQIIRIIDQGESR